MHDFVHNIITAVYWYHCVTVSPSPVTVTPTHHHPVTVSLSHLALPLCHRYTLPCHCVFVLYPALSLCHRHTPSSHCVTVTPILSLCHSSRSQTTWCRVPACASVTQTCRILRDDLSQAPSLRTRFPGRYVLGWRLRVDSMTALSTETGATLTWLIIPIIRGSPYVETDDPYNTWKHLCGSSYSSWKLFCIGLF